MKLESFLFEVRKIPGVLNAASSNDKLIGNENHSMAIEWPGKTPNESMIISVFNVSYDFLEIYSIELSEGRSFSREYSMETSKVILNEAAVKSMDLSYPIGKTIKFWGENMQIIGVTKNFLFQSLHEKVKPCLFQLFPKGKNSGNKIWIKIKGSEEKATIESLKKVYQEFNPGFLFEFKFIDDDYKALYDSENKVAILSKYFCGLAILISCLGLFGLAAFTAERRRKEIGVRKIFGSSVSGIIYLVSRDFTRLVLASVTIGLPVSYLIARHWLNSFAYRINLEWWFFVGAGLITLFIAWLTVGAQALKTANTNPSQCLKEE